ncbi:MAG TPA: AI-2E family transporter [Thermoanaerobaculia bacterium]|nr:AI-2E family transporter [Thermoanaerobaculia bacterium]
MSGASPNRVTKRRRTLECPATKQRASIWSTIIQAEASNITQAPLTPLPAPPVATPITRRPPATEIAAWLIVGAALLYVLEDKLVAGVIAGLSLYLLLEFLARVFMRSMSGEAARPLAVVAVALIGGGVLAGGVALMVAFFRGQAGDLPALMTKMADILESTRAALGAFGYKIIPEVLLDAEGLKAAMAKWLKQNAAAIRMAGGSFSKALVHVIMGFLLALLVFFRNKTRGDAEPSGPLGEYLVQKVKRFMRAFRQIAVAQAKISAVNTILTGIYLLGILPLFGKKLPFTMTIIVVTFLCGLIPILGNLISNTVIVIVSLGISPLTAIGSLAFLVIIHKLEYLVNSRIVGGQTNSQAWEILMAIIIGETAFGIGGVVMAPIIYAFVKNELRERKLV